MQLNTKTMFFNIYIAIKDTFCIWNFKNSLYIYTLTFCLNIFLLHKFSVALSKQFVSST